MADAVIIN